MTFCSGSFAHYKISSINQMIWNPLNCNSKQPEKSVEKPTKKRIIECSTHESIPKKLKHCVL